VTIEVNRDQKKMKINRGKEKDLEVKKGKLILKIKENSTLSNKLL